MDEQLNNQEEENSSKNKYTNCGHEFTPKPHHRLKYVKEEFNIQREDVQILMILWNRLKGMSMMDIINSYGNIISVA
ncbi:MAG: hypothetical protein IPN18_05305 [Ignavibacteriales bacterium]|nr:hypothetical protein [Ignavibacteriales bacterium]